MLWSETNQQMRKFGYISISKRISKVRLLHIIWTYGTNKVTSQKNLGFNALEKTNGRRCRNSKLQWQRKRRRRGVIEIMMNSIEKEEEEKEEEKKEKDK